MESRAVRIAIAEDEQDFRVLLKDLLERLGYEVVCSASNGAELLAFCSEQEVDVALVDFDMPVMDGLEAAEEITKMGVSVILISGHPEATEVVVENEPVIARLTKPPSIASLRRAIEHAVAKPR